MLTVQRVYELIDALAPFDTQADFDNSGLLVGNPQAEVTGIHLALDVTDRVIDDALAAGANLIVTHHPLMFSARKRLTEADYEGHLLIRLIANGLSLIAAHTNFDQAPGGMNDTLAGLLGLESIVGEGFLRVGDLSAPMTAEAFADFAARQLGDTVRVMGHREALIHRVGLCSGGGCDEWADAHAMGADAFLTGSALRRKGVDNRPFRAQDGCRADAALLQQVQMLRVQRLIARIVGGYAVRLAADDACALIGLAQGVYLRFPGVVI